MERPTPRVTSSREAATPYRREGWFGPQAPTTCAVASATAGTWHRDDRRQTRLCAGCNPDWPRTRRYPCRVSEYRVQVSEYVTGSWEWRLVRPNGDVVRDSTSEAHAAYRSEGEARAAAEQELRFTTHDRTWRD